MLKLIKSFKYDNSYDYIKMFSTKAEQNSYFATLGKIIIDEHNYIKVENSFNVNYDYDYLVENGVNYLMFNNGFKDYYAFIIKKEYIREGVTRLIYDIDVIQTFMFDFTLKNSFVERKKCSVTELTDFDEGLEMGEHIIVSDTIAFTKEYTYMAMFNGIKEQSIIFDEKGKISSVVQLPFATSRPLTIIDNIQYPCYFMPLQETYEKSIYLGTIIGAIDVVQSARKLLGIPYVWGGNYPPLGEDEGTDCSGLCMWAYNDCGRLEEGPEGRWTTYTMFDKATEITMLIEAQAGDFLFSNFSDPSTPEHVAIISAVKETSITVIEAQQDGVPIHEVTYTYDSTNMSIGRFM